MAMHGVALLGSRPDEVLSARRIAVDLDISEAHLSKVMQRLVRIGLVRSTRGPGGGFVLGQPPDRISLLDIYECIDGPLDPNSGLLKDVPQQAHHRVFGDLFGKVNRQVWEYLDQTTLSELSDGFSEAPSA